MKEELSQVEFDLKDGRTVRVIWVNGPPYLTVCDITSKKKSRDGAAGAAPDQETPTATPGELPYRKKVTRRTDVELAYNPDYGDDRVCACGHPYHRHFDSYNEMAVVGCKYCQCELFFEDTSTPK